MVSFQNVATHKKSRQLRCLISNISWQNVPENSKRAFITSDTMSKMRIKFVSKIASFSCEKRASRSNREYYAREKINDGESMIDYFRSVEYPELVT